MKIPPSTITQIQKALTQAQNIVIISHRNPDADTIGSNLALREFLESAGKNVTSACVDSPPLDLNFLLNTTDDAKKIQFQKDFFLDQTDLIITVDCGSIAQTSFLEHQPEILARAAAATNTAVSTKPCATTTATATNPRANSQNTSPKPIPIINIDHHPSNNNFGTINLVVPDAASTTIIIYNLFNAMNALPTAAGALEKIQAHAPFTTTIATALLAGLYYDTGSFMHSNVTPQVYECAAELTALGADIKAIVKNMYKNRSIAQLKTWGKILDGIKVTNNNVVVSGITKKELDACNATTAETSGIIDYLSTVKDAEFATLLVEDDKGNIRGSFRTRKDIVNLSEMAGMFGGGGHKKASGFTMKGELGREVVWKIQPHQEEKTD